MSVAAGAPATPRLRAFIRDTLGCTCPDAIFDAVEQDALVVDGRERGTRLVVGGRLLIYLLTGGVDPDGIAAMAVAGVRDRDANGLNRFRLVVGFQDRGGPAPGLDRAFAAAVAGDPKAHLHGVHAMACEVAIAQGGVGSVDPTAMPLHQCGTSQSQVPNQCGTSQSARAAASGSGSPVAGAARAGCHLPQKTQDCR